MTNTLSIKACPPERAKVYNANRDIVTVVPRLIHGILMDLDNREFDKDPNLQKICALDNWEHRVKTFADTTAHLLGANGSISIEDLMNFIPFEDTSIVEPFCALLVKRLFAATAFGKREITAVGSQPPLDIYELMEAVDSLFSKK